MDSERLDGRQGIGSILGNVANDLQGLLRGELRLARMELDQKFHRILLAAVFLAGGALLGFAGLVVFLQGISAALALWLSTWAASLIVGILIVAIGGLLVRSGLKTLSLKTLVLVRTTASLKRDLSVVKEHI